LFLRGVCNNYVDRCPHPSGCRWADYLNQPPAAHLRLLYPKRQTAWNRPENLARIAMLGFDPYDRAGRATRPAPRQARPAPATAAGIDPASADALALF
jgi:hypothetical protein